MDEKEYLNMVGLKNILVSIVIPVYNSEKTIGKCLDSLRNQTYRNIEIICVNDCSKDNSLMVLKEYAEKDSRIVVIDHRENLNAGGARNSGIRAAKGQYVCFVDNDDWLRDDAIELLENASKDGTVDVVACYWCETSADGQIINHTNLVQGGSVEENIKGSLLHGVRVLGALFSKSLITYNNLYYPERTFWEDNAIANVWIMAAKSLEVIEDVLYYNYTGIQGSSSKTISLKSIEDRIYTTKLCLSNCLKVDSDGKYIDEIKYRYLYLTRTTIYALSDFDNIPIALHLTDYFKNDLGFCIDSFYFKLFTKEEQSLLINPKGYLIKQYILYIYKKIKGIPHQIRHKIVVIIKKSFGMDPTISIFNRDKNSEH